MVERLEKQLKTKYLLNKVEIFVELYQRVKKLLFLGEKYRLSKNWYSTSFNLHIF